MMNDVAGLYSIRQEAVGMQVVLGLSVDRIAKYKQGEYQCSGDSLAMDIKSQI